MLTVVNVHGGRPCNVYIGRAQPDRKGSVLGIPRPAKPRKCAVCDVYHERGETIPLYKQWLWTQMQDENGAVMQELRRIAWLVQAGEDVQLGCWCKPAACHGDVVKAAVEWLLEQAKV